MGGNEVAALQETLQKQSMIIQRLQKELEEEREASATAADEAMSMILRLQLEKAEGKMEANQYKAFVTEKIYHTEESLLFLEDILFQKEKEIISLRNQVQILKCTLFSVFANNPDLGDIDLGGVNRRKAFRNLCRSARRNISLPATQLEHLCYEIGVSSFLMPGDTGINSTNVGTSHLSEKEYCCSRCVSSVNHLCGDLGENSNQWRLPTEDVILGKKVKFEKLRKSLSCLGLLAENTVRDLECVSPHNLSMQPHEIDDRDEIRSLNGNKESISTEDNNFYWENYVYSMKVVHDSKYEAALIQSDTDGENGRAHDIDTEIFTIKGDSRRRRREKLNCLNLILEQLTNTMLHVVNSVFNLHNPRNRSFSLV